MRQRGRTRPKGRASTSDGRKRRLVSKPACTTPLFDRLPVAAWRDKPALNDTQRCSVVGELP